MKHSYRIALAAIALLTTQIPTHATVILDDTFANGTRNVQNLPTSSAWFASSGASVTAAPGAMSIAMGGTAILAVTYFAPANAPVSLGVGDTLLATINFTFNNVDTANSGSGFRFAVCDFGTTRSTADLSSNSGQGANVQAYALFQNMSATFSSANPMAIMKRTTVTDPSLLGTGGDWTTLER